MTKTYKYETTWKIIPNHRYKIQLISGKKIRNSFDFIRKLFKFAEVKRITTELIDKERKM